MERREFLKQSAWMFAAAEMAGCTGLSFGTTGAPMSGFRCAPLNRIRTGVVGLGNRGGWAAERLASVPGVDLVALCDVREEKIAEAKQRIESVGGRVPERCYTGEEGYKALCESDLDVVYIAVPWLLHTPVALYALNSGRHALIEVPAATTIDDCWNLVETAERRRLHCMMLENSGYGEDELFFVSLVKHGLIGEVVHAEGGYMHTITHQCYPDPVTGTEHYYRNWRLEHNAAHNGDYYATHQFQPIAWYMDINRGDRLDYMVSVESGQFTFEAYARENFPVGSPMREKRIRMGDVNVAVARTVRNRTIIIQHDVSMPHPYSRINVVSGTRGILQGYPKPARVALYEKSGTFPHGDNDVNDYADEETMKVLREKYTHPLWKQAGEVAKKVGGHGGKDFLMDLRWAYCLRNGLPLDMDVYDLATWCSFGELSERSVCGGSCRVDFPDFTRGAWKDRPPTGMFEFDLAKLHA